MPKCIASHVTVSPHFITPDVTPAIGRSWECATEWRCTSTLSDRSKHRSGEAAIDVSSRMVGMLYLSLSPWYRSLASWLESSVPCREQVPLEMMVEVLEQLVGHWRKHGTAGCNPTHAIGAAACLVGWNRREHH